jgi:DNA topoisomerase-1
MMKRAQIRPVALAPLVRNPEDAAHAAELRYVSSDEPGIARKRRGKGFVYRQPGGALVTNPSELARIRALAIPPAWTDVWICRTKDGHVQATGRDARGRKQYRYHARFRKLRDEAKYDDLLEFAEALPKLRARLSRDLAEAKLTKAKVVATVLRLMERTRVRIGNDYYATTNRSYGLTTLRDEHAQISGESVEFRFRGKGGKPYRATLHDRRLAAIVKRCRDIPGQRLFQYVDDKGHFHPVTSSDVNEYLRRAMGGPFTAKSFRTWAGTVGATLLLHSLTPSRPHKRYKRRFRAAIERVAEHLGNTPAVCKNCYVHPAVLEAYESGRLHAAFGECLRASEKRPRAGLRPDEAAVLMLLVRLARARGGERRRRLEEQRRAA